LAGPVAATWQVHIGFSHQVPGFLDHVASEKAEVARSRHDVNVIVAGRQPAPQWLDMQAAVRHCAIGLGNLTWASNDEGAEPDAVMACADSGRVHVLHKRVPSARIRVVNVVDLMTLQSPIEHPHGVPERDCSAKPAEHRAHVCRFGDDLPEIRDWRWPA
jgi:xylulose-5-phosphate/fructose-6-phosphate phosphoketolase